MYNFKVGQLAYVSEPFPYLFSECLYGCLVIVKTLPYSTFTSPYGAVAVQVLCPRYSCGSDIKDHLWIMPEHLSSVD